MASSITNSGTLETAVQTWLDRTDISGQAADFIAFAQGYFNLRLRCRQMMTTADLSPTSGVFTLPSDYLQARMVVEKASQRRALEQLALDKAEEFYPDRPSGLGVYFTISGSDLRVFPTITNDIELTYYARFDAFTADGDADWLLTNYPLVYLLGVRAFAYDLVGDGRYPEMQARLDNEIDQLNAQDDTAEMAGAAMYVSGLTP